MPNVRVRRFGRITTLLALAFALSASAVSAQDHIKIETIPTLGHSGHVQSVKFSADGRRVLSGGQDGTLKLWDASSGRLLRTIQGHADYIYSVAFSPDGNRLLSGGVDKVPKLWDAATGALLVAFQGHSHYVDTVAFSPDGSQVASGSRDKAIKLWDAKTGRLLRTLQGHTSSIESVAFSPDGTRLLSGSGDKTIKLWDAANGALLRSFQGHAVSVNSVAYSADGSRVLSGGSDKMIKLWDAATGRLLRTIQAHSDSVVAVALSPDGSRLLSSSYDKTLKVWDAATGRELHTLRKHSDGVYSVAFSPDGARIISASYEMLKLWDASTGAELPTFQSLSARVTSVAYSADGSWLLSGGWDKTVRLWEAATAAPLRVFQGHSESVWSAAFSPDGARMISASYDKILKLWDTATGTTLQTFQGHSDGVTSVAFSHDGSRVVSGSSDKTLRLWDATTGRQLRTFQGHSNSVTSAAISPDGSRVLSGSHDNTLRLWDTATGRQLRSIQGHSKYVLAVAFSKDGGRVLSGSFDNTLKLWDSATGALLRTFQGHSSYITSVTFSPDGNQLLSGSDDKTVKLWDAKTGALVRTFQGHLGKVGSAVFSPDGRQVMSGSGDQTLKLWDAATGALLASLMMSTSGEWLAITPEGFFAASPKGHELLSVVRGFEVFSIDQFYQALYRPDLVREKLAGDPSGKVKEAAAKLDLGKLIASGTSPLVKFTSHKADEASATDLVTIEASIVDQGGGIGRAEWRVNGITIGVVDKSDASLKQQIALDSGDNIVELVVYNASNLVSSSPVRSNITWAGADPTVRPRLHVLVAGINQYLDGALKLTYAVPDARAMATAFQEAGKDHYEDVSVTLALDSDATAAGLDRIFTELAAKVRPRDVFVFFAAAHGKTVDGRYYMVPQDLKYQSEASLVRDGIGQDKLQAWFARIVAKKAVLIFDTCEAGSLASGRVSMASGPQVTTRGLEQKAALGRLIQATGRATLTATTSTQDAYEGYGGHGVFTFAILDALARGDTNGNGLIELAELIQHVDGLVPAITEKQWGAKQFPQMDAYGSNFSLARQVVSLGPSKGNDVVIPVKSTHINTELLAVFMEAGGKGAAVLELPAFTTVTFIKSQDGWVQIAKDGKILGYVAEAKLHKHN